MQKYTHDYTLPAEAESLLRKAEEQLRLYNQQHATALIGQARQVLQKYLSQDNMIPDNDVEPGWVKASDLKQDDNQTPSDPSIW